MSGTTQTGAPAATGGTGANPTGANQWLIAVLVAVATFMEVMDTTIANVALRYIAGGLGVSVDEASWVVTTYLVANAVSLTVSAFLAKMLGRKRFFLICLVLFTASSVLCGIAWNLQTLLLFRIMQGLGGGGMVPVASSILSRCERYRADGGSRLHAARCRNQIGSARISAAEPQREM